MEFHLVHSLGSQSVFVCISSATPTQKSSISKSCNFSSQVTLQRQAAVICSVYSHKAALLWRVNIPEESLNIENMQIIFCTSTLFNQINWLEH